LEIVIAIAIVVITKAIAIATALAAIPILEQLQQHVGDVRRDVGELHVTASVDDDLRKSAERRRGRRR
jgi:type IV secretory pathway component VirB8